MFAAARATSGPVLPDAQHDDVEMIQSQGSDGLIGTHHAPSSWSYSSPYLTRAVCILEGEEHRGKHHAATVTTTSIGC
jgi:hypothetical protein